MTWSQWGWVLEGVVGYWGSLQVQGCPEGHQYVSGLEEGEHCRFSGERGLGQGGTINSFFLQPRGRDSQLELPKALPLGPLLASKRSRLSRSPLRGHTGLGSSRGSFGKLFL